MVGGTGGPRGWATGGDGITNDLAFIVLNTKDGRRVGDVVGTNGIAFNQPVNQYPHIVGIPGATDQKFRCEGNAYAGPAGQQLMDNRNGMPGGASGGSWHVHWQPAGWAYQVGTFFGGYGAAAAGSYYESGRYLGGSASCWRRCRGTQVRPGTRASRTPQPSSGNLDPPTHTPHFRCGTLGHG